MAEFKILIIDDNEEDQFVYTRYLTRAFGKINITTVSTAGSGILFLKENKVDCILLDYNLPDTNGIKCLQRIKQEFDILIPIIMLTGEGNEKIATEAIRSGATDYLIKGEIAESMLKQAVLNAIEKGALATQLHEQEKKITHIAYHDYLTGLSNRLHFDQLSLKVLERAQKNKSKFSIILSDLDRFKQINDSLGHDAGDMLLQEIANRFKKILVNSEGFARLGGDEFILLIENVEQTQQIAEAIVDSLHSPFIIKGQSITVTISQGISIYPDDGNTVYELFKNADIAMYQAKSLGKNIINYFHKENSLTISNDLVLENAIRHGMLHKEFYLKYQPILDLVTGNIYGVEVLLRWGNEKYKNISITKIIQICEESGIIHSLGDWVTKEALKQLKIWHQISPGIDFKVSINLSPIQLDQQNWFEKTAKFIKDSELNPNQLVFELTESVLATDFENARMQINNLCQIGCNVHIDDFGIGHSPLYLLRDLPISGMKIDKSYIDSITTNQKHLIIVNIIIKMAEKLNFTVIIEGIETVEQYELLKKNPRVKGQGFFLEPPMTAEEITRKYVEKIN